MLLRCSDEVRRERHEKASLIGSTHTTIESPTFFIRRSIDAVISDLRPSKIHSVSDIEDGFFNVLIEGAW
ncbi:MAG: hypothetical protein NWF13_01430 [Candidatus Bathyarchaeota archaeon]|nr:hypothetical protein [Candidatus Bathyarchaeota archaeon]